MKNNYYSSFKKPLMAPAFISFILLISSGCTTTKSVSADSLFLTPVDNWKMSGKIAVRYPDMNCDEVECPLKADQGNIEWIQKGNNYEIKISDPFGKVLSRVEGNENSATLVDAQGKRRMKPNELIQRVTNLPVKFSSVRQWITGRIDKEIVQTASKTYGGFEQARVEVLPTLWRNKNKLGKMPMKILLKYQQNQVRFVIKSWESLKK